MDGQTDLQVDARSAQVARKLFHCSLARAPYKGKQYWDLLALSGQTVKNLRSPACKFKLDQRERKPSQVYASHGQTESQVNAIKFSTSDNLRLSFGQGFTLSGLS